MQTSAFELLVVPTGTVVLLGIFLGSVTQWLISLTSHMFLTPKVDTRTANATHPTWKRVAPLNLPDGLKPHSDEMAILDSVRTSPRDQSRWL